MRSSAGKAGSATTAKRTGKRGKAAPDAAAPESGTRAAGLLAKLEKLDLRTPFDLVLHLPLRYVDETHLYPIQDAPYGETVLVEGEVVTSRLQFKPKKTLYCEIRDASGTLAMRFFHFYGSQVKQLSPGTRIRVLGELRAGFFGPEMVHPQYRIVRGDVPLAEALTPVYPTTAGLPQQALRRLIAQALKEVDLSDTLPAALRERLHLPEFDDAVRYLHEPPPDAALSALEERTHPAWERLKFDELLAQQLSMRVHRRRRAELTAPAFAARDDLTARLRDNLPFPLTGAQDHALAEIAHDLARPHPMQRLLQGDVGSGKTVVAALAALQAIENGYQAALMAPTEILAEQHYRKLSAWLEPLGIGTAWVTSGLSKKEKQAALARIAHGEAMLAVGTHALFQNEVQFANLGLAIVDEQHRFGVHQRLALRNKGAQVHQLMMSATPIPRTLSMSYYADLDVSVIDELPPGRTPVVTKLVSDARRDDVLSRVRHECHAGRQAYWVCPLIEESEALQLQTAQDTYETLTEQLPELTIGLAHGRMASRDKAEVMDAFKRGDIQLLVATTVIEVGVDVPNASLMVIEHAERMGLAQLHQLRGRVGRGAAESACILLYQNPLSETARERLKIIFEHTDGFEIARRDLELRGPGEFLGARQSGVPMLRIADVVRDQELLEAARNVAEEMLDRHPEQAAAHLQRWLGGREELLKA